MTTDSLLHPTTKHLNRLGYILVYSGVETMAYFYHYKVVVDTHCQDTFQFKQHVKVNFASNDTLQTLQTQNL